MYSYTPTHIGHTLNCTEAVHSQDSEPSSAPGVDETNPLPPYTVSSQATGGTLPAKQLQDTPADVHYAGDSSAPLPEEHKH